MFHSDFDFACLEGLESLKIDNIQPQKIASSSLMATVPNSGTNSFHHHDESWVCMVWLSGLRRWLQTTVHLLLKELVEKMEELHFSALHSPFTLASNLKAPDSRVATETVVPEMAIFASSTCSTSSLWTA